MVFKWFCKILKSLMSCLDSKEYMEVRNALHVLTRIVDVFPGMKKLCDHLEKKVKVITEDDSRKDLQVQASQYFTMLQKAKPNLQTQENFCCGFAINAPEGGKAEKKDDKKAADGERDERDGGDGDGDSGSRKRGREDSQGGKGSANGDSDRKPKISTPLNPAAKEFVPSGGGDRGNDRKRGRDDDDDGGKGGGDRGGKSPLPDRPSKSARGDDDTRAAPGAAAWR